MNRKLICCLVAQLFATGTAYAQVSPDFRWWGTFGLGGLATDEEAVDKSYLNKYQYLSSGLLTIFDIKGRGSRYWVDLFGENLGRDDQFVGLRGGMYDVFKYRLSSDSLTHNFLFGGRTPYAGAGSATHTATFPAADVSRWNSLDISYKRRDDGGMFEYQGASPWFLRVDANQVTWKGSKPGASSQGTSPGNGFVDLSFPVDYVTRNVSAEGGYATSTMNFSLSWLTSKFENDNESLTWNNGYYGNGVDRTYLSPDNRYQRFMASGSIRQLPLATTLAARYTKDELKSNVALGTSVLSGTGGTSSATNPNVSSFDGRVDNETFTASASSTPMKALDTRLYYNYRKRDDGSTSVNFYGGYDQNHPYSYETSTWGFEAWYRMNRANRLGGGYDYNDTDRVGRADYDNTKDKRIFAEWRNTSIDTLTARLKYQRLERDSNFLHANDGTGPSDPAYLNRYVTAFDLANVDQDSWKLTLDFSPAPNLDFGLEGIIKTNEYRDNTLGRLKDDRREIYVNASYNVPGVARFTVFGDNEEIKYDSTHRIIGTSTQPGAYEPATPPTSSNYNWSGKIKDRNWAVGAAMDWVATEKLTVKASAIYYKTDGTVDLALQDGVPSSVTRPVPIADWDDTKRTSFNIKGVYAYSKTWTLTFGYAYEKYEYKDSQYDGYRNVITNSNATQNAYLDSVYANPRYKANFIYGLVGYNF